MQRITESPARTPLRSPSSWELVPASALEHEDIHTTDASVVNQPHVSLPVLHLAGPGLASELPEYLGNHRRTGGADRMASRQEPSIGVDRP